jgi:hypothetical protein
MNTTELIKSPPPRSAGHHRSATPNAPPSDLAPPTAGALLDEVLPLIGVVVMAGPPAVFVVVPWLLFALMLVGPFLILVTFALAAVTFFALTAAILSPPYLLVRHLRTHRTRRPERRRFVRRLGVRHATGFNRLGPGRGACITVLTPNSDGPNAAGSSRVGSPACDQVLTGA